MQNIWIIKPGEYTNRGTGITVVNKFQQIKEILNSDRKQKNGLDRTYIVQEYIQKPMLFKKRKFDLRCFMMLTTINGVQKGYWYKEGYIRTSSTAFSLKNMGDKFIHLTNDAVQKYGDDYGKFENGNKVSFYEFQKYLDATYP